MAAEDDDLYDEEYEFVDDLEDEEDEEEVDDVDSDVDDADEVGKKEKDKAGKGSDNGDSKDDEVVDEYGRPEPVANYVVHVYEYEKFNRTLEREFTPEDAEAFATEYNRTAKPYGRFALAGKNDAKPKKSL